MQHNLHQNATQKFKRFTYQYKCASNTTNLSRSYCYTRVPRSSMAKTQIITCHVHGQIKLLFSSQNNYHWHKKSIPQLTANDTRQHILYELYIIPSV